MTYRAFLFFGFSFLFGACATTTRGTHENVLIDSSPPGATAMTKISLQDPISLGDGTESFYLGCAPTPCSINIPRKKSPIITVSKSGYDPISFSFCQHGKRGHPRSQKAQSWPAFPMAHM